MEEGAPARPGRRGGGTPRRLRKGRGRRPPPGPGRCARLLRRRRALGLAVPGLRGGGAAAARPDRAGRHRGRCRASAVRLPALRRGRRARRHRLRPVAAVRRARALLLRRTGAVALLLAAHDGRPWPVARRAGAAVGLRHRPDQPDRGRRPGGAARLRPGVCRRRSVTGRRLHRRRRHPVRRSGAAARQRGPVHRAFGGGRVFRAAPLAGQPGRAAVAAPARPAAASDARHASGLDHRRAVCAGRRVRPIPEPRATTRGRPPQAPTDAPSFHLSRRA